MTRMPKRRTILNPQNVNRVFVTVWFGFIAAVSVSTFVFSVLPQAEANAAANTANTANTKRAPASTSSATAMSAADSTTAVLLRVRELTKKISSKPHSKDFRASGGSNLTMRKLSPLLGLCELVFLKR